MDVVTGTGTTSTNPQAQISLPRKGYLIAASVVCINNPRGPLWCQLIYFDSGNVAHFLVSGTVRSDANYTSSDGVTWEGRLPLDTPGSSPHVTCFARNDSGSNVGIRIFAVVES